MTIAFYTLGCKVNQYESESMKAELLHKGFAVVDGAADVLVVNSCTVTAESDRKTRQLLSRLRRENPESVLVLTGCMVQAFPDRSLELDADIIIGNTDKRDLYSAIESFVKSRKKLTEIPKHISGEAFAPCAIERFSERTRAYIKIEDGCNKGCTYCIIPKARGRVRSRDLGDIAQEAGRLAKNGYKEVVLTGINLSSYQFGLGRAVRAAADVDGIERVRLGSLEPDLTDTELLKELAQIEEFCPGFHLSLQSGCDETLRRMNRRYTSGFYYELIEKIKDIFESPAFTTDVMVGFAGETDEEFEQSLEFIDKIGFTHVHIFPYSRRDGTAAALFDGQISKNEKARRCAVMAERAKKAAFRFHKDQIGKKFKVLVESDTAGYSENYIKVKLADAKAGEIVDVKITAADGEGLTGIII